MDAKAWPDPAGLTAHLHLVAPPHENRTGGERPKVMIPATVACSDGTTHAVVIRDMSAMGAKLGISRRHRLPHAFTLAIPGSDFAYPVVLKWQRGDFAGVELGAREAGRDSEAG